MKPSQSFLTFLLLVFCSIGINAANTSTAATAFHYRLTASGFSSPIFGQTDTLPKKTDDSKTVKALKKVAQDAIPKVAVPKIKPPKVNTNLFKKIADAFKFRKNAQAKEKKRVLDIFESLGTNDSIAASAENIRILIDELSIRENQHFDSLIAIINDIKSKKTEPALIPPASTKEDLIVPEASESKAVTDKDIEDLTNKLLPLITEKANETKNTKDKRATLALLRKIRNGKPQIQYATDTIKNIVKRYILSVKNRAEVYGIHNFNRNNQYEDYKFNFLNTLVYNTLFVNGKTGNIKDLNGWDSAKIITDARNVGCKVVFTARIQQAASVDAFLTSFKAQKTFAESALFLLKSRNANGVNIQMDGLTAVNKNGFTQFIKFLSEVLKNQDTSYKVLVTLPGHEISTGYDLKALAAFTDRFLVNFSVIDPVAFGPMTPLKGTNNSIETTIGRYLNQEVSPDKLIVSVSYIGTKWAVTPGKKGGRFIQPLTYSEIRSRYGWPVYYDDASASAVMDSLNKQQAVVRTVFYDDAVSLEKKYDYIIDNSLGGVCINALGYDRGYADLWDALSYKFATVDTVYLKDSILSKTLATNLTLLEKASRYLTLFSYVLNNPCEVCFENIPDTAYAIKINQYLQELKVDSLIIAENKTLPLKDKYHSKFEYVNSLLTSGLGYLTLFILILTLIAGGIYLYKIKTESDEWAWKKNGEIILIGFCILLVISTFTYLFTNDAIPIFGATPSKGSDTAPVRFSKDLATAMTTASAADSANVIISDTNANYCTIDPNDECINMPFPTLMIIIGIGMVIGILITRYLIMPLLRRNDIP
ncbi:MAG: glycoside hydrolase family 18 protein [Bacteroidota bacterium]